MKNHKIDLAELNRFPVKSNHFSNEPDNHNLSASFREAVYLDTKVFYTKYFGKIPNIHRFSCSKPEKALDFLFENYQNEICDHYYRKDFDEKLSRYNSVCVILWNDVLVKIEETYIVICFRNTPKDKVELLTSQLIKFKNRNSKESNIHLIMKDVGGFDIKKLEIKPLKLNISENYNKDFQDIHEIILKRLKKQKDKGIVLLYGKPGTGKTSYLRYLISKINKNVVFLPPNLAEHLTDPDLVTLLVNNPNSIFVIEDAENIVLDRGISGNSAMSTILNLSDGLLSDCLNMQLICSFNVDISKVDSALLRKGRLIAKYEFNELEIDQAQQLSNKLGFSTFINKPMTVSEIYNQEEKDFQENRGNQIIGFGSKMGK